MLQSSKVFPHFRGKRFYQRGASLLEGISYLGIAAVVVLGAVSLLSSAYSGANTNRTYADVTAIRTGVKKLFMGQGGYGNAAMNATLVSTRIIPSSLTVAADNTTVTNAWQGAVVVTGNGATFTISYASVPQDVCINLVSNSDGAWTQVAVNGGTAITTFPVAPATAAGACDNANANTIVWTSA